MDNYFSITETRLIQNLLSKKSDTEIADLLDKQVAAVSLKIAELTGINKKRPFKEIAEEKSALEIKAQHEKALAKEERKKARAKVKNENEMRKKLQSDYDKLINERKKQQRKLQQESEQRRLRKAAPLYKSKIINYSQLVTVRIDSKTTVYAKPGEDPEAVRKRYINCRK